MKRRHGVPTGFSYFQLNGGDTRDSILHGVCAHTQTHRLNEPQDTLKQKEML